MPNSPMACIPCWISANFAIDERERVGLIGRNGTGKSSLLKVITGLAPLDDGEVARLDGLKVVLVEQEPCCRRPRRCATALVLRGKLEEIHDERERWRLEARLSEFLQRLGVAARARTRNHVGRRTQARRAGLALALRTRPAAARRADQPSGHRWHHGAGRALDQGPGVHRRHPRPLVSGSSRHTHHRARPRPAAFLSRQLRGVRRRARASSSPPKK